MQGVDGGASLDSSDYELYFISFYLYHFPTIVAIDSQNITFILYGSIMNLTKLFPVLVSILAKSSLHYRIW